MCSEFFRREEVNLNWESLPCHRFEENEWKTMSYGETRNRKKREKKKSDD